MCSSVSLLYEFLLCIQVHVLDHKHTICSLIYSILTSGAGMLFSKSSAAVALSWPVNSGNEGRYIPLLEGGGAPWSSIVIDITLTCSTGSCSSRWISRTSKNASSTHALKVRFYLRSEWQNHSKLRWKCARRITRTSRRHCDIFRYHLDVKQSKETHNTTVNLLLVYRMILSLTSKHGWRAAPKNWGKAAAILVQSKSRRNCTTFNEGPMGHSRIWSK